MQSLEASGQEEGLWASQPHLSTEQRPKLSRHPGAKPHGIIKAAFTLPGWPVQPAAQPCPAIELKLFPHISYTMMLKTGGRNRLGE